MVSSHYSQRLNEAEQIQIVNCGHSSLLSFVDLQEMIFGLSSLRFQERRSSSLPLVEENQP